MKKKLTTVFESAIKIVLERSFCDNLVAFHDLLYCVKNMWLQSHVATTVAIHYLVTHWSKFDVEIQNFQIGCMKVLSKLQSEKFVATSAICENNVAFRISRISFHALQS